MSYNSGRAMVHLTDTFISLMKWLMYAVRLVLVFNFVSFGVVVWTKREYLMKPNSMFSSILMPWREMFYMALSVILFILPEWMEVFIPGVSRPLAKVLFGTFWIVVLSISLFVLKVRGLRYYAVLECSFALTVCVSTLLSMKDDIEMAQTLTLLTSAYLFIRGMDNFRQSLTKAKVAKLDESPAKVKSAVAPSP